MNNLADIYPDIKATPYKTPGRSKEDISYMKKKAAQVQRGLSRSTRIAQIRKYSANYKARKALIKAQPVKRGSYRTSGRIGKTRHPIKKPRDTYFHRMGSVKSTENGGTTSVGSQNAIYLGHGPAVDEVYKSGLRSIVKLVMKQAKRNIDNWDEIVEFVPTVVSGEILRWTTSYKDNPATGQIVLDTTFDIDPAWTYNDLTDQLENNLATAWTNDYPKEVVYFRLYRVLTTSQAIPVAKVLAKDVTLRFRFESRLAVQNRTLALVGTDDHDADNIANNPLVGKLYYSKKRLNGFKFKVARPSLAVPYVADKNTGLIKTNSTLSLPDQTVKPPPFWFFDTTWGKNIKENPGDIFSSTIDYSQNMKLNNFFSIFRHEANNGTLVDVKFGNCAMFGLEKMLDSGRALGEAIALAFEINQKYSCAYSYKPKVASAPIFDIGTVAI